ncbi:MAG: glycosyl hydrolase, partial [Verrucomicrobia bacterium]|nr:glycosyl hydrolase [Verrucomicrobiota bacterium]
MNRYLFVILTLGLTSARAGNLAFSDPANTTPPPAGAIGFANRAPDFDAKPGFQKPPPGFGVVPFFWWLGDPLTKERLGWILDQMAGTGIAGYQINYAHSDQGGRSYGLTMPSEPPLFSEEWWKLAGWFMQEARKQGAGISLSDYTLGFGQGWCVDEILRAHPDVTGMRLRMDKDGKVSAESVPWSLNPMHPMSGKWYAEKFFGQFERRFPGEGGKGLNFFFSDELSFGVSGHLWSEQFADEFKKRKGYDITPELPALFRDIGPRTPKIRLDYNDVLVSLSEEGFFKPVFDWHQERGMIMGCDHGGRGQNVVEFGDYFRTQRWNQGPGADQPGLGKNLIKTKVAASIAHLYQRPRVWLEGFYGSGWGTTSAGFVDATFTDFVMGYNLLAFHGMYYSTHGGWWEWAPPDNTFRMPYWQHMRGFMDCVQRLAYVLSQGHHRCDVAILYPVAPMEAGLDGALAVETAFTTAKQLYGKSVDFDFMDFESLARAKVAGQELQVSGENYRVLILPAMKAVRFSTFQKALEFHRAGGLVVAIGALPEASDRVGRDDPEVAVMVKEIFPDGLTKDALVRLPSRDYDGPGCIQHRKLGPRDLYAIYDAPKDSECFFRATGQVELWDPWTGATRLLAVTSQAASGTKLKLPLTEKEIQLIVFSPGQAEIAAAASEPAPTTVKLDGDWEFELQPTSDNRFGDFHWPPTSALIGAEVRQLWCCQGDNTNGPWRKVTCSFGPQFMRSSTLPPSQTAQPYEFSWRWGLESDPGHQGYHGLKEEVHDEFLAIGKARNNPGHSPNAVSYESDNGSSYFSTTVLAPRDMTACALTGDLKPAQVWLNGEVATNTTLKLKAGANPLVLQYTKPGRAYFVVSTGEARAEAGEAIFSPSAFWIWYPGETLAADRWFRKAFELDQAPAQARLRITCDNSYTAAINGVEIGSGSQWEKVQEYDVAKALRAGRNEITVRARNDGGAAGLIAELTAGARRVATDRTWRVAKTATGEPVDAEPLASFADSMWYKHQHGPPKLEALATSEPPKFKASPLATSWWKNPQVLPFDV